MQIYRGRLKLLDYVFYATVERGKIYETGAFIHNYALTYALGLAADVPYTHLQQAPDYEHELSHLNGIVYVTPALPRHFSHRLVQWNTIREGYGYPSKETSIGYPDWGFARVLRPESDFIFCVLVADNKQLPKVPAFQDLLSGRSVRIRLGKFLGKVRVVLETAAKVQRKEGPFSTDTLLNWRDCPTDPIVCDVMPASLPTRLLNHVHFPHGVYYQANFETEPQSLNFPANMGYLARSLSTQKGGGRK